MYEICIRVKDKRSADRLFGKIKIAAPPRAGGVMVRITEPTRKAPTGRTVIDSFARRAP